MKKNQLPIQKKLNAKCKFKKSTITFLFLVLHGSIVLSQNELWTKEVREPQTFSPQIADMIRFDNTASDLNSGRIDLSIPLINFTDPDFDLPIKVRYNSIGFIPSMGDGFIGLNWSLSTGGIIYREVKGIPDDMYRENTIRSNALRGFLGITQAFSPQFNNGLVQKEIYINPRKYIQTTVNGIDDVLQGILSVYSFPALKGTNIEACSDIYHFTFGNYSGTFLINFDGTVSVVSHEGGHLGVNLSEYFYDHDTGYNQSIIKIITDDGYTYCFGGSYDAMEYMALSWVGVLGRLPYLGTDNKGFDASGLPENTTNTITSFHLSKIIAPNGRELNISYRNLVPAQYHKDPTTLFISTNFSTIKANRTNESYTLSGIPCAKAPNAPLERSYSLNKVALIDKIWTDDKTITFYYSPQQQNHYPESEVREFGLSCGTQLDSISLQNQRSEVVESASFKYFHSVGGYPRMFLNEINLSKIGIYHFSYNKTHSLPNPLTKNIDHWKFWRGSQENQRLLPITKETDTHDYEIVSDDRDPNCRTHDVAMLYEVSFPTGGRIRYQYEPHEYRSEIIQTRSSSFFPRLVDVGGNKIAGGARISKISFYDKSLLIPVKKIYYRYTWDKDSEISSGILMYRPHYVIYRHYEREIKKNSFVSIPLYSSSGFNLADYASDHVRYSTVIECTNNSQQKADSTFRLYITPLDDLRRKVFTLRTGEMGSIEDKAQCVISGSGYSNASGRLLIEERGRTVREFIFNSSPQESTFRLLDLCPKGVYRIRLQAEKNAYVSIKIDYPGTRINKTEGPCKETKFTDYLSNSDYLGVKTFANGNWVNSCVLAFDEYLFRNFLADPFNRAKERGKPLSEFYYDEDNRLIRSIFYAYDRVNTNNSIYIKQPPFYMGTNFGAYSQIGSFSLSPYLLTRTTVWDHTSEGVIGTVTSFTYDQWGYLKNLRKQTSEEEDYNTDFIYSFERNEPVYQKMKQLNFYALITDKKNQINRGSEMNTEHLSKTYTLGQTIKGESKLPIVSTLSSSINTLPIDERVQYLNYDAYGNLIYKITEKTIHTVYLWGYGGKHLIAKIEHATYDEVKQALGGKLPETLSAIENPDMKMINGLRIKLPNSHVFTYTYKLLTGVTSETDPSGQTVYYSYDSAGRLTENYLMENGRKKIIVYNEYHIVNQ